MKYNYYTFLLVVLSIFFSACNDEDEEDLLGNWSEMSDFDGVPRSDAIGFSIGDKGYIGTGYDGDDRLNDFWEYDPALNYWTQKANLPGSARAGAVGLSINGKGYVGTGYDGENKMNDFYEYDPESNSWKQIADFPGSARYGAVGFSIDDKGFVGTGYDGNYLKDFYAYSPASDSWVQIVSIGGSKRVDATSFVLNGKGYVISGLDNGSYENNLWEYDPSSGMWTEKRKITNYTDETYDDDYTSIARISAVGFSINGYGYISTGSVGSLWTTVWEYDPDADLWTEKTEFEGPGRVEAVGFAIGSKGYVTTGRSSGYYLDDIWSFDPKAEYDEDY